MLDVDAQNQALTARQQQRYLEILAALDALPTDPEANRRQRKRMALRMAFRVTLLANRGQPTATVFTRNISTSGIGCLSSRPFKRGELFVMHLAAPKLPPKMVLSKAIFCRYLHNGLHEVGAEFIESRAVVGDTMRMPVAWVREANPDMPVDLL